MKSDSKVIIVTGANTGLGLALVRGFCQKYGDEAVVYLTARNQERGLKAVSLLNQEELAPAFHLLDVANDASVAEFASFIEQKHGGVDIFVSNAAARILPTLPQSEQVENFVNTNNHGTYRIIQAFRHLLNRDARFLVVASSFGSLSHLDPALHGKFNTAVMSLEDVESVMDEYAEAMVNGTASQLGWPDWINIPSKIGQVASVRVLANEMREQAAEKNILINAVCPGLVDTDASRPWFDDMSHAQSPDEAAVDVIWLATLPPSANAPYGELVQKRRIIPFIPK